MQKRIEPLDFCRGLCIVIMIGYHALADLVLFGRVPVAALESLPAQLAKYTAALGFILISGIVSQYSRSPLRRGLIVLCAALAVSVAGELVGQPILFGILHFLGFAMLLRGLLARHADIPRGLWFPALCLVLFAATAALTSAVQVNITWLFPLGLRCEGFYSADYYPLLPWIFVYFLGVWLGGPVEERRNGPLLGRSVPRALTFPGRHSLIIYLLHQPVLYGLCLWLFGGA